jgi:hypothetical protein
MRKSSLNSSLRARIRAAAALAFACCLLASTVAISGCIFSDEKPIDEGIVRSESADVYSSTALVALKVATVKRGDVLDILGKEDVTGPTSTESWLQVRLKDDAETNGWIEARHVVRQDIVNQTAEIAGKSAEMPPIARGRLKVNQRLRLQAGREAPVAATLSRGTEFDIIGKAQTSFKPEKAKPKPGVSSTNADQDDEPDEPDEPEEQTDVWYRVRLDEGMIIRGGWVLAQSVSLEVPDEILHLEGEGRRFVAWLNVGNTIDPQAKDPSQTQRNNYVTFMRRGNAPDDVDFERIYCLFWDADTRNYYAPYVDSDLRGVFPVAFRDEGGRKIITANVLDAENKPVPIELEIIATGKGKSTVRRITPPVKGERISSRR